jgi:ABC-type xylose transport system permease subunit
MGLFEQNRTADWRQLWRVVWAMIIATPLAAFLRGVWLNSAIIPVFVLVLAGVSALGMLAWRGLWALVNYRKR